MTLKCRQHRHQSRQRRFQSNLEDGGLLVGQVFLQQRDELLKSFLDALLFVTALIFGELSLLFLFLGLVDGVAANVAQGHLPFLSIFRGELAELLATLLSQWRHVDADDLAVVVGGESQFTHGDCFFDPRQGADVEGLDLDGL